MKTQREPFVQHLVKVLEKDLLEQLNEEDIQAKMLWHAEQIIDNSITHIIRGIHVAEDTINDAIDGRR